MQGIAKRITVLKALWTMNLKELSETLGLSQTTVSRALNGYPEVSEATRTRVEMAARKFNYSPSSRAKGLATGKALAIGHVIPTRSKHEMVNPVFGDFIAGAGEIYAQNGYEMILSIVNADANEETVYRGLQSRRAVDGVVIHGPRMADDRIPQRGAGVQHRALAGLCLGIDGPGHHVARRRSIGHHQLGPPRQRLAQPPVLGPAPAA